MSSLNEAKERIRQDGFLLLESVLTENECAHYKDLLEQDHAAFGNLHAGVSRGTSHSLQDKSEEKVVYNLHNKHPDYMELFCHPKVLPVVGAMLQEGSYKDSEAFHILNISARSPSQGTKGQQLHLDSNLPGGDFPLIMIALWMLDGFSAENGATRVVPGSHRRTSYAEDGVVYDDEVSVTAPAGSVLIYNAALWHGGGPKTIPGSRWAVILGYGRWFIKPSFDFMQNTPRSVFESWSDEQRELFGFRSNPPKDEFTRIRRRSDDFDQPFDYQLPK